MIKHCEHQIYRALSQSPVDRAMDDAAKLEQTREVSYGEIEREVQVNLLSQEVRVLERWIETVWRTQKCKLECHTFY